VQKVKILLSQDCKDRRGWSCELQTQI